MTTRFLPILLALLGMTLPAEGQTPAQTSGQTANPARFLLASIVVEGVRHDSVREIAAAESLLQPGREYSEQELREAVYRVKRLPFVLDAEFSLREGGEPGSYQLVITVEENRLFFYSVDVGGIYDGDERNFPGEDRIDWGAAAKVGGRWFVGSQGLVSASVQGFDRVGPAAAQVGYTRYNLFGRGGFATVALATDISDENDGSEAYQGSFSLGLPIVGNHSIRTNLLWLRSKDELGPQTSRSAFQSLDLSWVYDTTDDPLFPTSGTLLSGGGRYSRSEYEDEGPFFSGESTSDGPGLTVSARRHWALTHRHSVSANLLSSWDESDTSTGGSFEEWRTTIAFGHSMDLWGFEKTERIGDLRWENTIQAVRTELDAPSFRGSGVEGRLVTGLAFRNAWGLLRFTFSYAETLESDFASN